MAKTIYDKIWESHLVDEQNDGTSLLYIDRHLVLPHPRAHERCFVIKPWLEIEPNAKIGNTEIQE